MKQNQVEGCHREGFDDYRTVARSDLVGPRPANGRFDGVRRRPLSNPSARHGRRCRSGLGTAARAVSRRCDGAPGIVHRRALRPTQRPPPWASSPPGPPSRTFYCCDKLRPLSTALSIHSRGELGNAHANALVVRGAGAASRSCFPIPLSIRTCGFPAYGLSTVFLTWLRRLRVGGGGDPASTTGGGP
jgi:hypothetical protein